MSQKAFRHMRQAKIQISLRSESTLSAFWLAMYAKCFQADNEE